MKRLGPVVSLVVFTAFVAACDKRESPHKLPAASDWSNPGSAGSPGGGADVPHAVMGGADPHAGMGGADPHAGMAMDDPHAAAAGATDQPADPNQYLRGVIVPGKGFDKKITPGAVIFVSVRPTDASGAPAPGMPIAVDKLTAGKWPLAFELTPEDAMGSPATFKGDVVIQAWVDQDGDGMTKPSGEVVGQAKAKVPADKVELKLDGVRP